MTRDQESGGSAAAPPPERSRLRRAVRGILILALALVLIGIWAWCVAAISFSNLPGHSLRLVAAGLFGLGWVAAFALRPRRGRTALWFLGAFVIVLAWWLLIPASNDRDWVPEHARMPTVEFDGERVTIRNIRNCDYRTPTDFDVHYHDLSFDLEELKSVDYVCSDWGLGKIVHTMITFGLADGEHFVLSIVPRRETDEPVATNLGSLFKQYELIYILADECDVLRLRTNFRKEDLYVFPTTTTPEQARTLFLAVAEGINDLSRRARYYNLVTHNCTTGLVPFIRTIRPSGRRWNWRYLINAYTAEMAYGDGWIASPLSPEETLRVCHVNQYVENHPECDGYSRRIRPDLRAESPSPSTSP